MKHCTNRLLLFVCCLCACGALWAQNRPAEQYLEATQHRAALHTGKLASDYPRHLTNHPYLGDASYAAGTLSYCGVMYPHVRLRLDRYRNELTTLPPDRFGSIILDPANVDYADLHGHRVIYFRPDGRTGCPREGYCQLLYESDRCAVLEFVRCSLQETRRNSDVSGSFRSSVQYYIRKDDVYYPVKNKSATLKVFGAHRKELSEYIRTQRLDFRRTPGAAITALVIYYETQLNRP